MSHYGRAIRRARAERSLSQTELAEITGIPQANISAIETGRRLPSVETFHRLLLGCGFELVAAAGSRVIGVPAPGDDFGLGDVPPEPPETFTAEERQRIVADVLHLADAIVRSKAG